MSVPRSDAATPWRVWRTSPASAAAALVARALDCDSAGERAGVGSNGTHPMPVNQTSTHECASRSRTRNSPESLLNEPGAKPAATRAGMPAMRSMSAMAPENCWQ